MEMFKRNVHKKWFTKCSQNGILLTNKIHKTAWINLQNSLAMLSKKETDKNEYISFDIFT